MVRKQWKRQMLEAENTEFEYGHDVEHKTKGIYEIDTTFARKGY